MASASDALLFSIFLLVISPYETQGNDALLGEPCAVDKNCISAQMVCGSGTCKCFRGQYPSEDRRNCIATTSGLCFDDSDCRSLPSSRCFMVDSTEGICTCNDGYSSSEDERKCLRDASYQESCEEAAQCTSRLGYQAVCKEGRCECEANNHYSVLDGRCIADVGLLGACVNTSQCVISDSRNKVVCENSRCTCAPGYEEYQDTCKDGAQNVIVSGAVFLLYWITKFVIT